VTGVVLAFARDDRLLAWDVWNEPGADNAGSYPNQELRDKTTRVIALLPLTFAWARAANPTQPLTSGVSAVDTMPRPSSGEHFTTETRKARRRTENGKDY